ncbi:unnamed protein product [Thelazia callipaeda]|uniref:PL48 domain-containing protein n=1 Tax=Thelazia callipaeda TaxID=103827 RepID=A0A0N5CV56_THECL|nr:unnamed protein product [Thelazia callipaeda]
MTCFLEINSHLVSGSVGDLRLINNITHSTSSFGIYRLKKRYNQIAATFECELQNMVGHMEIKIRVDLTEHVDISCFIQVIRDNGSFAAIAGFARITPGDAFEVSIKHGLQKWKTRGKTQANRTQIWDRSIFLFECHQNCPIDIKACFLKIIDAKCSASEVHFFKSKTLCERSLDPIDIFYARPQLVTIGLNQIGTLKLELITRWIPLTDIENVSITNHVYDSVFTANNALNNVSTSTEAVPHSSNQNSKSQHILREKKFGNQLMRQKKMWRSSTNILDSVYDEISKSIPDIDAVEALPVKRLGLATRTDSMLVNDIWRYSVGAAQITSNAKHNTFYERISLPSPVPTEADLLYLIELIKPFIADLIFKHPEISIYKACLNRWEKLIKGINEGSSNQKNSAFNVIDRDHLNENDENLAYNSGEQTCENDSGIDSLRQYISPFNGNNCATIDRIGYNSGVVGSGPSQRRFRQMKEKERRKSCGGVLDLTTENKRFGNSCESWLRSSSNSSSSGCSLGNLWSRTMPDGISLELHLCLRHHLKRCLLILKTLASICGPLEYRENQMLGRLEQETSTLSELLKLAAKSPSLSLVRKNVIQDFVRDVKVQEVWIATVSHLNTTLIVPIESLRQQIRSYFGSIVESRYPDLVSSVVDTVMSLLTDKNKWEPEHITIFQFVGLFRGKHVISFVENLAHEALITSELSTRQVSRVKVVMDRLSQVPVVPPLESLRHISLVLVCPDRHLQSIIEGYLTSARGQMHVDLVMCYICLLEHENEQSRKGACRALGILRSVEALKYLAYLWAADHSKAVREEAYAAAEKMGCDLEDRSNFEITKI